MLALKYAEVNEEDILVHMQHYQTATKQNKDRFKNHSNDGCRSDKQNYSTMYTHKVRI